MNILSHFIVPEDQTPEFASRAWRDDLAAWLRDFGLRLDINHEDSVEFVNKAGQPVLVYAGDLLFYEAETQDVRHATYAEWSAFMTAQAAAQTASSTDYELVFTDLGQSTRRVIITATEVQSNERYLMFMNQAGIVLALPHAQVVEFNTVAAAEGNIKSAEGTPVRIGDGGNKYTL